MYPIILKSLCHKVRMGVKKRKLCDFAKIDMRKDSDRVAVEISFTIIKIVLSNQIWQPF